MQRELADLSLRDRVVLVAYLLPAGVGGVYAGAMLLDLGETWVAWSVALLIVEPIALACLLGAGAVLAPDSMAATFLWGALERASFIVCLLLFCFATGVVGMTGWALWQYLAERAAVR